jgi:hypothetical protein
MTSSSDFVSEFIRGVEAGRPQVAEDWLFVQGVASPRALLLFPVMLIAIRRKFGSSARHSCASWC